MEVRRSALRVPRWNAVPGQRAIARRTTAVRFSAAYAASAKLSLAQARAPLSALRDDGVGEGGVSEVSWLPVRETRATGK
jgi:hypothetical protein